MGPKSYEQCAGFLKIPEGDEPLDNTWVHPENYRIAREIRERLLPSGGGEAQAASRTVTANLNAAEAEDLKGRYGIGDATLRDILEELGKPGRDPREGYPGPVMQKGVLLFEDLAEGMVITGKVKNVVDFGAFVDLGIKETALVHVSELSDKFVKDPLDLVKVGDVLEFRVLSLDRDRRRIGLSRKAPPQAAPAQAAPGTPEAAPPQGPGRRRGSGGNQGKRDAAPRTDRDDDGTMYNPFAAAFRKRGRE
jgi:uncharacterized protein